MFGDLSYFWFSYSWFVFFSDRFLIYGLSGLMAYQASEAVSSVGTHGTGGKHLGCKLGGLSCSGSES